LYPWMDKYFEIWGTYDAGPPMSGGKIPVGIKIFLFLFFIN
jgi:hypothetical protein